MSGTVLSRITFTSAKTYASLITQNIGSLHQACLELNQRLADLPGRVHELLSGVRGSSWPSHVRRYCLVPINLWPRLPSRENWERNRNTYPQRPSIPSRVDWLLELIDETDPQDHWQRICAQIDEYINDVVAVAPELNAQVDPESDGPYGVRQWRHDGKVVDDQLEPAPWKMVNHLWKLESKSAVFSDLIQPIYGDREHEADEGAFGSHRKKTNQYFDANGIPWKVCLSKGTVSLMSMERK